MRILVDSDVFVDHLRGHRRFEPGRDSVHYSSVTRAELFAGHATDERRVRQLVEPFIELPVDRAIAERAGRLRRTRDVRLGDALIAATAAEHRLQVVTRNQRHFARLPGVRVRASR